MREGKTGCKRRIGLRRGEEQGEARDAESLGGDEMDEMRLRCGGKREERKTGASRGTLNSGAVPCHSVT